MGGCNNAKERKKQISKKGQSGVVVIIILLILFIFLTSTQRVEFNNKQISTASVASCKLIGDNYDAVNRICVKPNAQNQTIP